MIAVRAKKKAAAEKDADGGGGAALKVRAELHGGAADPESARAAAAAAVAAESLAVLKDIARSVYLPAHKEFLESQQKRSVSILGILWGDTADLLFVRVRAPSPSPSPNRGEPLN